MLGKSILKMSNYQAIRIILINDSLSQMMWCFEFWVKLLSEGICTMHPLTGKEKLAAKLTKTEL